MNRKLQKECESSTEYLLPDYMGDIKKLLSSKARAVSTGKFVGEGNVEVSGSVEYDLLYVDAEGKLTAVNASSDFNENFAVDTEVYIDSAEESRVCDLKVRVTGPRKISLKADVHTSLTVSEENELHIAGDVFSEEGKTVEKCTTDVVFASSVFAKSGEREYAEIAEKFEGITSEEIEVVYANGTTCVKEVLTGDGEVTVKGENIVSAILAIQERPPVKIKKSIPFEEVIAVEGAKPEMTAIGSGFVSSADIGFGIDEGEGLSAVANIIAEYNVELIENESATVVTDAYTVECDSQNKYAEAQFLKSVYAGTRTFCVDVKADKREEKLDTLCDVISMEGEIRTVTGNLTKGGCDFNGEIAVIGVGYETNVDGSVTYIPIKIQGGFDEKVNLDLQLDDKNQLEYIMSIGDCEVINDAETLTVRCTVSVRVYLTFPENVRMLVSCESIEGEKKIRDASVITVYYPRNGERLFDVAKKYRTTSAKIANDNSLTESALASFDSPDSLVGIKKLIIR